MLDTAGDGSQLALRRADRGGRCCGRRVRVRRARVRGARDQELLRLAGQPAQPLRQGRGTVRVAQGGVHRGVLRRVLGERQLRRVLRQALRRAAVADAARRRRRRRRRRRQRLRVPVRRVPPLRRRCRGQAESWRVPEDAGRAAADVRQPELRRAAAAGSSAGASAATAAACAAAGGSGARGVVRARVDGVAVPGVAVAGLCLGPGRGVRQRHDGELGAEAQNQHGALPCRHGELLELGGDDAAARAAAARYGSLLLAAARAAARSCRCCSC